MTTRYETAVGPDAADTANTLFAVDVGGFAHGTISTPADRDFIAVDLIAGQTCAFAIVGIHASNLTDSALRLLAPDGVTELAQTDSGLVNGHAALSFTAPATGRYFLEASGSAGATGDYAVSASLGDKPDFDAAMRAGILDGHTAWTATRGSGVNLDYGFADTNIHLLTGFSQFTEAQKGVTRSILAHVAELTGLTFAEIAPGSTTDAATLLYGNFTDPTGDAVWGTGPGDRDPSSAAGDVWINTNSPPTEPPSPGSAYYALLLRGIGQSLGLTAPGHYSVGAPGLNPADDADFRQDSLQFTVMSGFDAASTGASALPPQTFGIADIQALQWIYGANTDTRSGDDTYGFGSTAGQIFDFDDNLSPMATIWDGGGHDTIDLSHYGGGQILSLIAGSQSSIGGYVNNLGIAHGVVIENATGGRGSDAIIGNDAPNILQGGAGDDTLDGGAGDDSLYGGSGSDTLRGGAGNDVLYGDDSADAGPLPDVFDLVAADPATGASLSATSLFLGSGDALSVELIWQQIAAPDSSSVMLTIGSVQLLRDADGSGSILFGDAVQDGMIAAILPPALFDGLAHRLSIVCDNLNGTLVVYLDGLRSAEISFVPQTLGLPNTGDILFGDAAAIGDLRIFDQIRSAAEVRDNAWTLLSDTDNIANLQHYWQGDGQGNLANSRPYAMLQAQGPTVAMMAMLQTASLGNLLDGGMGDDTYHIHHIADRVVEGAGGGHDRVFAYVDHRLDSSAEVEELHAMGSAGLSLTGNAGANQFFSNAAFADTLTGGAGNDIYTLRHIGDRVIEGAGGGRDVILTEVNHRLDSTSAVEELRAIGTQGLRLTGNGLNNKILGATGADSLKGGAGRDQLYGGSGADRLQGGADRDHLYGGSGADRFIFSRLGDSAVGSKRDVIHDFKTRTDDIDLRGIDANTKVAGNQAFAYGGHTPLAFGLWLVDSKSGTLLCADVNGDGRADFELMLSGTFSLSRGDFFL